MKYAGMIKNDFSAAPGTCVTLFTQGCPHHCAGCHNPETWSFEGGRTFDSSSLSELEAALIANGVHRDLCIMGGEPLCPENEFLTLLVVNTIKEKMPDVKIYIWTGYTLEELQPLSHRLKMILSQCEAIVDGRYIESERDITLFMRGSKNQRIIYAKDIPGLTE